MISARILIVEDEKIISLDLRRRLERFGYEVCGMASTGADAVAKADELGPDIILMDIMLSGEKDGIEAATQIKRDHGIPVIFLTAYADDKTLERAKAAEPFGYVLKPFKERELYSTIDIALYKSRADRRIKVQEQLVSSILNSIGDGIIATDEDNRIRFMNPIAESLTGWTEDAAKSECINDVLRLLDDKSKSYVQLPRPGEAANDEGLLFFEDIYLENKQGATVHIEGNLSQIRDERGEVRGHTVAFRDVTDIKELSDTITYQASHDSLTGLINRDEFFARLQSETSATEDNPYSVVYIDLDQFKVVNDVCGHLAGDELLRQVSGDIQSLVDNDNVTARLGGDEFGVLLKGCTLDQSLSMGERILSSLRRKFIWQNHSFNISASIGLVPVTRKMADVYAILAAADDACYLAKESGGNAIKVYETADYTFLKRRGEMQWISRLTSALEHGHFVLYAQPIRAASGDEPDKYEILLRLREDDGTIIGPGDFIPAAERYNLMPSIDRWVIAETITFVKNNIDALAEGTVFCINVTAASIADESLLEFFKEHLESAGLSPASFCIELTETAAIENFSRAVAFIKHLKAMGASFALDDFGNGFSSFAYLKKLPVDFLKIDGSFVQGVASDASDHAMVEAVNRIGHVMGMRTIAEYVMNDDIVAALRDLGVDYLQGFTIAEPAPLEAVVAPVK
jgi:diguanylate cyclase (GGDEF)-like protein/PAS domain S-box-containing protein